MLKISYKHINRFKFQVLTLCDSTLVHRVCYRNVEWRTEMVMQTSDILYRRHEQEWAAFRDAVVQSQTQKRNDAPAEKSGHTSSSNK